MSSHVIVFYKSFVLWKSGHRHLGKRIVKLKPCQIDDVNLEIWQQGKQATQGSCESHFWWSWFLQQKKVKKRQVPKKLFIKKNKIKNVGNGLVPKKLFIKKK